MSNFGSLKQVSLSRQCFRDNSTINYELCPLFCPPADAVLDFSLTHSKKKISLLGIMMISSNKLSQKIICNKLKNFFPLSFMPRILSIGPMAKLWERRKIKDSNTITRIFISLHRTKTRL